MSRDKQNEYYELERLLRVRKIDIEKQGCDLYSLLHKTESEEQSLARYLIDFGYLKSTELAEEIFAEIEKLAFEVETYGHFYALGIGYGTFAELKKKYTEITEGGE